VKLPVTWLREFANPQADVAVIAAKMAACGFAVEDIADDVIDFEVTANRPDCLSVYGLAREVATAFDLELKSPTSPTSPKSPGSPEIRVTIESELCGRYAVALADVTVGPSPGWLVERLAACGIRAINNIVDVTNYVMLEMGHPMHAFDVARLSGGEIRVRAARTGEKLTTLDGETRTLDPSMLVIADRDHAVAVAGVMGGRASEVSGSTARIALESAWFQPASVRGTSRRLGLKTEASSRFERGADIEAPRRAIDRALALLEAAGAGPKLQAVVDEYPHPAAARVVAVARVRIARLLGAEIPASDVERILTSLGFAVDRTPEGWRLRVPSFRVDVSREADAIEEIGRHWGFDRIPATFPAATSAPAPLAPPVVAGRTARRVLTAAGLEEAVSFTFLERSAAAPFVRQESDLVEIANPLSEKFAVLRPSLLPGLLDACLYNQRRQQSDVRLFETGSTFSPAGERAEVGWVVAGVRHEHWSEPPRAADFFDATGVAQLVASAFGVRLRAAPSDDAWFVPGRGARLFIEDRPGAPAVGMAGQIKPAVVAARGGSDAVVAGVLWMEPLLEADRVRDRAVTALPRFPSIVRDLSIVIDERLPAETVRGTIRANAPDTLEDVREFDRYQGKGIPDGQVSLSVRLTFRGSDRTLTDEGIQGAVDGIIAALAREHDARLR
jgi:phenylalanyl-tRNA synthetase beta chain